MQTLGRYIPIDSFVHRLDPRLKIISLILLLITVFFDAGFIGYAVLGAFTLLVLFLSKLKPKEIISSIKPMLFMIAFLFIFNVLFIKTGNLLYKFWIIEIYDTAVYQSLYVCVRLIIIILLTTSLTATTKPLDLTLGLEKILKPLTKIHFPTHEIAMMISIALRFIPTLMEETQRIMKAQASRGVDFDEGTIMQKIMSLTTLIIPLFISSFQKAEDLANAMESRNYNPNAKRTRYRQLKWTIADGVSFIVIMLLCIGIIVMSFLL